MRGQKVKKIKNKIKHDPFLQYSRITGTNVYPLTSYEVGGINKGVQFLIGHSANRSGCGPIQKFPLRFRLIHEVMLCSLKIANTSLRQNLSDVNRGTKNRYFGPTLYPLRHL